MLITSLSVAKAISIKNKSNYKASNILCPWLNPGNIWFYLRLILYCWPCRIRYSFLHGWFTIVICRYDYRFHLIDSAIPKRNNFLLTRSAFNHFSACTVSQKSWGFVGADGRLGFWKRPDSDIYPVRPNEYKVVHGTLAWCVISAHGRFCLIFCLKIGCVKSKRTSRPPSRILHGGSPPSVSSVSIQYQNEIWTNISCAWN